jgi:LmbE family N-acetylglucosaminyl deacetylase
MRRHLRLATTIVVLLAGCAGPDAGREQAIDLMVFAPHPDDETLGCSGILHQALKRGERVKVVIFTNGDGFPAAASLVTRKPVDALQSADFRELARFRQLQSKAALEALGGTLEDLVFLGYPDSALLQVYRNRGKDPTRQRYTGMNESYGEAAPAYRPAAPYGYDEVLADVAALLVAYRPRRICVTAEADRHPDHQAVFRFVRDALVRTGLRADVDTYLIHGGPQWPWPPTATPEAPYEAHEVKGLRIPQDMAWPPPRRVKLTLEEARIKAKAIGAQASHLLPDAPAAMQEERAYLESFVKSEEVFWPAR